MGNGRSFSRNRKGSPGKSKRRLRQQQQALLRARLDVELAAKRASASFRASIQNNMPEFRDQMEAAGVDPDEAEKAVKEIARTFGADLDEADTDVADSV